MAMRSVDTWRQALRKIGYYSNTEIPFTTKYIGFVLKNMEILVDNDDTQQVKLLGAYALTSNEDQFPPLIFSAIERIINASKGHHLHET